MCWKGHLCDDDEAGQVYLGVGDGVGSVVECGAVGVPVALGSEDHGKDCLEVGCRGRARLDGEHVYRVPTCKVCWYRIGVGNGRSIGACSTQQ